MNPWSTLKVCKIIVVEVEWIAFFFSKLCLNWFNLLALEWIKKHCININYIQSKKKLSKFLYTCRVFVVIKRLSLEVCIVVCFCSYVLLWLNNECRSNYWIMIDWGLICLIYILRKYHIGNKLFIKSSGFIDNRYYRCFE